MGDVHLGEDDDILDEWENINGDADDDEKEDGDAESAPLRIQLVVALKNGAVNGPKEEWEEERKGMMKQIEDLQNERDELLRKIKKMEK